jgi:ABC-type Fe3+-hydroxamate transport system substrate-binding protein
VPTVALDDLGTEVPLPRVPRRIVSLVPNLSETLWGWGVTDRLVAVTEWCVEPAGGFPHATRVRGTKNPDVDGIVDLAPDLVVANEEENRELDVRRLRAAGTPVYVTRVRTVADVAGCLERLGAVVDAAEAATGLAGRIRAALERAEGRSQPRGRVFCPVWRGARADDPGDEDWWALGRDTYGGDLLARCRLDVVPAHPGARYPRHRLAAVAGWDPDVVLLPDEPYRFTERDREAFAGWRARVVPVDGRALWWWGPRTSHALETLSAMAPTPPSRD